MSEEKSLEVHLKVKELSKSFGSDLIFENVTFDIKAGESVTLIGANGSGKSTLLRCCLNLIEASSGSITLFDQPLLGSSRKNLRNARSKVGFVFQKHNLVPRFSVLSNVLHGALARKSSMRLWLQGLASSEDRLEALDCLDRVGLAHLAGKRADQISGGQSQRVAIARALMQRPKMIVADEPVASLDPNAGKEVMDLFAKLSKESGITLIFVSHNLEDALSYSDRVIALQEGALVLDASSASQKKEELGKIYG